MADPSLAAELCAGSVYACLIRVAELDEGGVPLPGAATLFRSDGVVRVDWQEDIATGSLLELSNGCGVQCVVAQGDDRLQGITLNLQLCKWEASLLAKLTGNPVLSSGGVAVGQQARLIDDDPPARVSVEAWAKAWDGNEQATDDNGALIYKHWHWPSTTWRMGQVVVENGIGRVPMVGKGRQNANYFDGPGNDAPEDINGMWAWHWDTNLPSSACGAQTLAAS